MGLQFLVKKLLLPVLLLVILAHIFFIMVLTLPYQLKLVL